MVNIIFCDDDEKFIERAISILQHGLCETGYDINFISVTQGMELVKKHNEGCIPDTDILFLDVEMDNINGIDIKNILQYNSNIKRIVFISSHDESIPVAFGLKVVDFLRKPLDSKKFVKLTKTILDELRKKTLIECDEESFCLEDLLYIEVEKEYSKLYFINGRSSASIRRSLKNWLSMLPPEIIIQINKHCVVNLMYVNNVPGKKNKISISGTETILDVSRVYRDSYSKAYQRYKVALIKSRIS